MIPTLPPDLTALHVRELNRLRASLGSIKLYIRRAAIDAGSGITREIISHLRPMNEAIDAINAEEARRDEAAFQQRVQKRATKTVV